jgi:hypothetical protein
VRRKVGKSSSVFRLIKLHHLELVEDVGYRQDQVKRVGLGFELPELLFGLQILEATAHYE